MVPPLFGIDDILKQVLKARFCIKAKNRPKGRKIKPNNGGIIR